MTRAQKWLQEYGRFRRQISLTEFRKAAGTPKGLCTWCEGSLPPRRRKYCSNGCRDEVQIRCHTGIARYAVHHRDKGVCSACGLDTRTVLRVRESGMTYTEHARWLQTRGFHPGVQSFWQMDHVVPISEGGGMCGLEGLRTLCVPCHKKATKELASRRANQRRGK